MKLANRIAIITGAGSGIGRAAALLFAAEGATVVGADVNETGGQETLEQLEAAGGKGMFVPTDVSQEEQVKALVDRTAAEYGRIDIMFHNAGVAQYATPVEDVSVDVWDRMMNVNAKGVFFGFKYVIPVMKKQRSGVNIVTASTAGPRPRPGLNAYCASKGAVIALARGVALEVAPYGVRVVCINPVAVQSPMLPTFFGDKSYEEGLEAFAQTVPLGRLNTPEDVARAALFLASDDAAMITGTELYVDGARCIM